MSPTFTEPTSGWSVECRDCPHTIGPDYGEPIYPGTEFTGADAERLAGTWAARHRNAHPGHQPSVGQFQRFALTVTDHDPEILKRMFDGLGAQRLILGAGDTPPDWAALNAGRIFAIPGDDWDSEQCGDCAHEKGRHIIAGGCADCERDEPVHARCTLRLAVPR